MPLLSIRADRQALLICPGPADWVKIHVFRINITGVGGTQALYTAKVMDHFKNPRNVGIIQEPSVLVQVGEPACGDALLLSLKIEDDRIVDVKYKIYGCGAAIATASVASEMVTGMPLDEVLKITDEVIAAALDGLPPEKMHCSNMAAGALHGAIREYRKAVAAQS